MELILSIPAPVLVGVGGLHDYMNLNLLNAIFTCQFELLYNYLLRLGCLPIVALY